MMSIFNQRSEYEIENTLIMDGLKPNFWKLLQSRTFWTLCAMFVINGFQGIREQLPAGILPYVDGVLSILTIYFAKVAPRVDIHE